MPSILSNIFLFFFFNDPATTEIYTLSLHDALPIYRHDMMRTYFSMLIDNGEKDMVGKMKRSEEHTSELQSRQYLVCRLLLEKKKNKDYIQSVNRIHQQLKKCRAVTYNSSTKIATTS